MNETVLIYTDGACSGNPGEGGWGAVLIYKEKRKEISGYEPLTTNNRMELSAAINALEALNRRTKVDLYSDSTYLCNAFNKGWLKTWSANGFMRKTEPVPNADLWKRLIALTSAHEVAFHHVRGHADDAENNRCDELARKAIVMARAEAKLYAKDNFN